MFLSVGKEGGENEGLWLVDPGREKCSHFRKLSWSNNTDKYNTNTKTTRKFLIYKSFSADQDQESKLKGDAERGKNGGEGRG